VNAEMFYFAVCSETHLYYWKLKFEIKFLRTVRSKIKILKTVIKPLSNLFRQTIISATNRNLNFLQML
jgi:hypothetical protein